MSARILEHEENVKCKEILLEVKIKIYIYNIV